MLDGRSIGGIHRLSGVTRAAGAPRDDNCTAYLGIPSGAVPRIWLRCIVWRDVVMREKISSVTQ
jgi:hypothetical protein